MSKPIQLVLGALSCAVFGLALAGPAGAATTYVQTGKFAKHVNDGTGLHTGRIAVSPDTGDIYVANTVDDRVDVYRPNATTADPLTTFGSGDLIDPHGIAIDPATGDVFVSDSAKSRIRKFTNDGGPTPTFTLDDTFTSPGNASAIAFDPSANQLVYIDPSDRTIKRATTAGAGTGTPVSGATSGTAFTGLQDLAVTSTGEIIVIDSTGDPAQATGESRIERFAANGDHSGTLGPVAGAATVAVIPDGDQILVSGKQDAVNDNSYATLTVFANDGTETTTFTSSEQYSLVTGVAAAGGVDTRLYVASDVSPLWGGAYGDASVQAFEPFVFPTVTPPTISEVTESSARLTATINPQGGDTSWRFEYAGDGSDWVSTATEGPLTGTSDQTVSVTVEGLDPATDYTVRLVATKGGEAFVSDETPFTTHAVVPVVQTEGSPNRTSTTAQLRGRLNPQKSSTSYYFEWGADTSYGNSAPAAQNSDAGSGDAFVPVVKDISGLTPGTAYHYRLVATNQAGTTRGADATITTRDTDQIGTGKGADGDRGIELVSQPGKNAAGASSALVATHGNRVQYRVDGGVSGSSTGANGTYLLADRGDSGWSSRDLLPPRDAHPAEPGWGAPVLANEDLTRFVLSDDCGGVVLSSCPKAVVGLDDRANATVLQASPTGFGQTMVAVADATQVVTEASDALAPEDADSKTDIYRLKVGGPQLLSRLEDGSDTPCDARLSRVADPWLHVASDDGDRVYFTTRPDDDCALPLRLYLAEGGVGVPISGPALSGPESEAGFIQATPDGSKVFYHTESRLDPDDQNDTGDVYRYTVGQGNDCLTCDVGEAAIRFGWHAVVSEDGSHVYFVSDRRLLPGVRRTALYVYDVSAKRLRFIAPYQGPGLGRSPSGTGHATPSGEVFTFDSAVPGVTTDETGGYRQQYLYDDRDRSLVCVSCPPQGAAGSSVGDRYNAPVLPRDGRRMYFTTADPLVASDTNGTSDAYEWHDGRVGLLTDGVSDGTHVVLAATSSGRDVLFTSDVALTHEVTGGANPDRTLYDARIGGGFAAPPRRPQCEGEACQSPIPSPPSVPTIGLVSFAGEGGGTFPSDRASASVGISRVKGASGSAVRLKVRVPGAGRISVAGRSVHRSSVAVTKAGSYSVTVALTSRAKKSLKKKHRLTVGVRVSYRSSDGQLASKTVSITFTQPKSKSVKAKRGGR